MATVFWIVLADAIVFALFVYRYRSELGLTAAGWNDISPVQKKPIDAITPKKPPAGRGAADER